MVKSPLATLPLLLGVLSLACSSEDGFPDQADSDSHEDDSGGTGDVSDDSDPDGGDGTVTDDGGPSDSGNAEDEDGDTGGDETTDDADSGEEDDSGGDSGDDSGDDSAEGSDAGEEDSSDGADDDSGDSDDSGGGDDGDDWVEDVSITVDEEVNTILEVTWNQVMEADEVWLEFTYEGGEVMTSRPRPGATGSHRDVVLGVPGETEVTVRIVSSANGTSYQTSDYQATTEAVPSGMPEPTIVSYDAAGASPEKWMFGSVEDTPCADGDCDSYRGIFWLYIMDRQGRIVWYYADPSRNISSSFQRVARDGEYIVVDKGRLDDSSVVMMSLDHEYYEELVIPVDDCIDVTDTGLILHNERGPLYETNPDTGDTREIWNCSEIISGGTCYSNTVNWNPLDDTVLMSFPYQNTVVEVDRASGDLVAVFGDLGDYEFDPSSLGFEFNHFPTITPQGTLLVSSHMPGVTSPQANEHAFMEFEIDRTNQTLTSVWLYQDGPEWPRAKGMALRVSNGNTLVNYGTGGTIREVTPDNETVFHVKFDVTPEEGGPEDDWDNKMVGHNLFVDDLYSLNEARN